MRRIPGRHGRGRSFRRAAAGLATFFAVGAGSISCVLQETSPRGTEPIASESAPTRDQRVFHRWKSVSFVASDVRGRHAFRAASAVYRKRLSADGWITYHDLAELELTDLEFESELAEAPSFAAIPSIVSSLFPSSVKGTNVFDIAPAPEPEPEPEPRRDDSDLPPLTRILSGRTKISMRSGESVVTLQADAARYDLLSETLFLDAKVVVRGQAGRTLRADRAVLSARHNGLYLPVGGDFDGRQSGPSYSLVLDARGTLSATPMQRPMEYEDMIAAREKLVLSRFAEKAPPALRPLVTALLAASRSRPVPPAPPSGVPDP